MTGVLAKLAGVNEITVMFPGKIDDLNLMFAASHLIGAKSVLNSGGAHTLAAVAFGTESIGRVDKVLDQEIAMFLRQKDNFMAR